MSLLSRIALLGNLRAPNSTENDWKHAFEQLGFTVDTYQEDDWIKGRVRVPPPDDDALLLWVRTWAAPEDIVKRDLTAWADTGVPIVGAHLDRWFGLIAREDRQNLVYTDPYFQWLDWWFCSDPSALHWDAANVNFQWMPPAVSTRNPLTADPDPDRYPFDVVFVGNTDPQSYHPEHTHRFAMLDRLRGRYGGRFGELPGAGRPRIVGADLTTIYRTVPVVIGDSALVGLDAYWSDRIPETLGRGGFLAHPLTHFNGEYEPGVHLACWRLGDWRHMFYLIDDALAFPDTRQQIVETGQAHVLANHTYKHRAAQIAMTVL